MSRPTIRIHNVTTNEVFDREMDDAEFEAYQDRQKQYLMEQAETKAKASAKADLLKKLGITAEEAVLLLS